MNQLAQTITEVIRGVKGSETFIPLHEPTFKGNELSYVQDCIKSTFVSSVGTFVDRFEAELANYTGAKYAVAVVNGTAALQVALLLAGVAPGDEVLVPALTFVGTANAVRYCDAVPHFVDSEEHTLGMDPEALRSYLDGNTERKSGTLVNRNTGRRISVILPVHIFGHPCNLEGLLAVARDFDLVLVEDAAESIGSWYYGRHTGRFGKLGTFSFNGNKIITTGGGGAILTDDPELARRAKHLTTTAKLPHRWSYVHDEIGYNYRMPNLNAALGLAQLEKLSDFLASKRRLYKYYRDSFVNIKSAKIFAEPKGCRSNYWLQTLILNKTLSKQRDLILDKTNSSGVMTRPAWTLLNKLTPYKDCPHAPLNVAKRLELSIINLPSGSEILNNFESINN